MYPPKPTPRSVLLRSVRNRMERPARASLSEVDAERWLAVLRAKAKPDTADLALIYYLEHGGRSVRP